MKNPAVFSAIILMAFTTISSADDVLVKDVHLCCGSCVAAVNKALKKVPGVSGIACDRNGKTVLFRAKDAAAAKKGIVALAKAGFHGSAVHGKKALPFPKSGAKKGTKAAQATFGGVHLCCSACVTAARKSLSNVPGVESIDIDRKEKTVTVRGKAIDITAAVKALNKGGFHALLQPPKKKK